ncbi:hypothetical protein [Janthinobacterium sp. SUN206]|uniref:hypothetical protein n=1 Tax=Janthinobacterium sp. SUN206 TaxID=3014787 RepID=UPI002713E373|nr:hypothetical protein [Janthinobacterium sp. SUN206]MDO8065574.1 hypothetical protein [Janthinobacterium sp. SUN206]
MAATEFLNRIRWRRTPQEMAAIVTDVVLAESPTQQEVLDQLDIDVVRHFQRMLDVEAE